MIIYILIWFAHCPGKSTDSFLQWVRPLVHFASLQERNLSFEITYSFPECSFDAGLLFQCKENVFL